MCGNCDIVEEPVVNCEVIKDEPQGVVFVIDDFSEETAKKIEGQVLKMNLTFMDVKHTFLNKVYTRTGTVKAGQFLIGTKHKKKNILHISKGKIAVYDNFNGFRILEAPHSEISFEGIQRIGYVLEDFEGSNIFETEQTTVDGVENEMLHPMALPENVGIKILNLVKFSQDGVKNLC